MKNAATQQPAPPRRRAAPQPAPDASRLDQLVPFEAYQLANVHLFPGGQSLRWFYRTHRQELIEAQAVVEVAGRSLINVPAFNLKVLEIGTRNAAARVGEV